MIGTPDSISSISFITFQQTTGFISCHPLSISTFTIRLKNYPHLRLRYISSCYIHIYVFLTATLRGTHKSHRTQTIITQPAM